MSPDCEVDLQAMIRGLCHVGLSQEAIALALEVNQSTISRILSGRHQNPKFKLVVGIQTLYRQHCCVVGTKSAEKFFLQKPF